MDLAVVMRQDVLADKLEDGRVHGRVVATWNTRRLPTRLTPGWTNRLFVASQGRWRGYFPLSGDVFWNPQDEAAPYALIVDPRRWTPIATVPCPSFRGWRYLESPPGGAAEMAKRDPDETSEGAHSPPRTP
jgi:hypothetical protein